MTQSLDKPHAPDKGRVTAIDAVTADTRILRITPDNPDLMRFSPGQYMHLSMGEHDFRPYSIASAPHKNDLEFHIRDSGQGLSHHAVHHLAIGDEVSLQGPFGVAFSFPAGKALVLIAGGVGISPVKSIVEAALDARLDIDSAPQLHVIWGVRDAGHLYLDAHLKNLAQKHANFTYTPVIAASVADAVDNFYPSLENTALYLAGPKPMIDATLPVLLSKNAQKDYIFSDAFTL